MIDAPLTKQPSESRLYSLPFATLLDEGETLISVQDQSVEPDGLSVSGLLVHPNGLELQTRIAGGVDGVLYHISALVLTSAGNTLEADGYLKVKNL